jgi:hypothetical protein
MGCILAGSAARQLHSQSIPCSSSVELGGVLRALHVVLASAINSRGETPMNASIQPSAGAIAAQPIPSAGVSKFFALKPRLFINGEWVEARSADSAHQGGHRVGQLPQPGGREHAVRRL